MLFKDVIGQQPIKQQLIDMVSQNRLSHALLFLGKEGAGGLPLAMVFAQYISSLPIAKSNSGQGLQDMFGQDMPVQLPTSADGADTYMQRQPSFARSQQMVHPDIHYTYPVITKKSGSLPISSEFIEEWRNFFQTFPYGTVYDWLQFIGAENKQGNITVHECNDIIRKLNLKSFESGYKILVLWMPEYLGKEGNKLLKLIEEPPDNTLFILVAENEEAILSTILSRCQVVKIPAIETKDIQLALTGRNGLNDEEALRIANVSQGNFREALHLLQHSDEDFFKLLRNWLNASIKYNPAAQLKSIEEMAKLGRENQKHFLKFFMHLVEQALRIEVLEGDAKTAILQSMPVMERELVLKLNKTISVEQKQAIAEEISKASYYIERNANAKILFHALTIKLFHIIKHQVVISV